VGSATTQSKTLRFSGSRDPARLLRAYRDTGDLAARERVVELYLPLVRALARRYANRGERFEDLVQVGSVGLIQAIDRFDPGRGCDFGAFATPTICGEIQKHLRDRSAAVRVPRRLAELTVRVRSPRERLSACLRRPPTVSELAAETGLAEAEVVEALQTELARTPISLSARPEHGEHERAMHVDGAFGPSDDRLLLAAGFRTLAERERRILHLRFYGGLSQAEIAGELGLSQIQVSRLIRASLERMRSALGENTANATLRQTARGL
jgi:RNA polymerase sigma-B factor